MAPPSQQQPTLDRHSLDQTLEEVESSAITVREKGLRHLRLIFDKTQMAENLHVLADKSYHRIYEVLFRSVLKDKSALLVNAGKTSSTKASKNKIVARIELCADILKIVVRAGTSKLKAKTVEAVLDHITQTLPNTDGQYFQPIIHSYLGALSSLFEHKPHIERLKPASWNEVVDFCLQGIEGYLDQHAKHSGTFPPLHGKLAGSLPMDSESPRNYAGNFSLRDVDELSRTLLSMVSTANAPVRDAVSRILTISTRLLRLQSSTVGSSNPLAFSIVNALLLSCREDQTSLMQAAGKEIIPIILRFWQATYKATDELQGLIRDEMLIFLFTVHLYLERSLLDGQSNDLASRLTELSDIMRSEYCRRSDKERIQLEELDMVDLGKTESESTPFHLYAFRCRTHSGRIVERNWATLQAIGLLERLIRLNARQTLLVSGTAESKVEDHPRKRQKTAHSPDRILHFIKNYEVQDCIAGLQILPFVLRGCQLSSSELEQLLVQLSICISDKRDQIASWAFLAIASCTFQTAASDVKRATWLLHWNQGARACNISATCRAAAVTLHAILRADLAKYHDVAESIDAIMTTADISGPVTLCDASVWLMMHLVHTRVTELPGSSLSVCQHVVRWLFSLWNPADISHVATMSVYPHQIIDILRTALGLKRLSTLCDGPLPCGPLAQAWHQLVASQDVVRYLLLLDDPEANRARIACTSCEEFSTEDEFAFELETSHFQTIMNLVLELVAPKVSNLLSSCTAPTTNGKSITSTDQFRRAVNACLTILFISPHFEKSSSPQLQVIRKDLDTLAFELVDWARNSHKMDLQTTQPPMETLLQVLQPYLPRCSLQAFLNIREKTPQLLHFYAMIEAELSYHYNPLGPTISTADPSHMDIDDFHTTERQAQKDGSSISAPRQETALEMSTVSFYNLARQRLLLLGAVARSTEVPAYVPHEYLQQLLSVPMEELQSSRRLLREILQSDFTLGAEDVKELAYHLCTKFASRDYTACEVTQLLCLDFLIGLYEVWPYEGDPDLSDAAVQIYEWFVEALQREGISLAVQKTAVRLFFLLWSLDSVPAIGNSIPSARSNIIKLLTQSPVSVKFYIGNRLPDGFEKLAFKDHDELFMDIESHLPDDSDFHEGIAFRLFVFAKLASRWSSLLRRCIYHLLDIPAKVPSSLNHSTKCIGDVALALKLSSPRTILALFARQLLFTWPREQTIRKMPFEIFGFESLEGLLSSIKEEAVAQMAMRGWDDAINDLAEILHLDENELLMSCFTKVLAYSIVWDMSRPRVMGDKKTAEVRAESRIRERLGEETFLETLNYHFTDVVGVFFEIIDDTKAEQYLLRSEDTKTAGEILHTIKSYGSSNQLLPPNQQPFFRVKDLSRWITHLCKKTEHQAYSIYTPALLVSIARKLLDTIHPSLGSLHACAVLRKLRVLIAFAGSTAIEGYPLEMLVMSTSPFLGDSDCSDDAIGILKYLLSEGSEYLIRSPSFVAGATLSILGSLRGVIHKMIPDIQTSQHVETLSKVKEFHIWLGEHLSRYASPHLKGEYEQEFRSLVYSACNCGPIGNANVGTHESNLLMWLLADGQADTRLLSAPSREAALNLLCENFQEPESFRTDVFENDDLAVAHAAVVWESCGVPSASKQYMAWAGRIIGRAFAASGLLSRELLQESDLPKITKLSSSSGFEVDSSTCIINLLQSLTSEQDQSTAGLAEVALRYVVTEADVLLAKICTDTISPHLLRASTWLPFTTPPSESMSVAHKFENLEDPYVADAILKQTWLRDLSIDLARNVSHNALVETLEPILRGVSGFSEKIFPFIVHLALSATTRTHLKIRKQLSECFAAWLDRHASVEKDRIKTLINAILYLRTQRLPSEKSPADRSKWLDIDYLKAAKAAAKCGMFKTALLFVEEFCSIQGPTKTSRRSSAFRQNAEMPTDLLLNIFENIDDPDMYYGVQQSATLSTILARLEHEKDGPKSLSFRGAHYDRSIRNGNSDSIQDIKSLSKVFDVLNLSGLSYSLFQSLPAIGMDDDSRESMFRTARKLEQWDIPAPDTHASDSMTLYRSFQSVYNASDQSMVRKAINEGLQATMLRLVRQDLNASALHGTLQTLAALAEMDEVFSARGSVQFEDLLARFRKREGWMKTGTFDDISQILSSRGTTLSILSRQPRLQSLLEIQSSDARLVEVRTALLHSELSRCHKALHESLSVATSLTGLLEPCREVGLNVELAVHLEAANALWDQGEMASSIGMLQSLEKESSHTNQAIVVGKSEILSKIGFQVSVARLEKADKILESYLKPALKELKGIKTGNEAGNVFHQFAVFCDEQLQDRHRLDDIERLERLIKSKEEEIAVYEPKAEAWKGPADKNRYLGLMNKSKAWLKIDAEELKRHVSNRAEFLSQCLENYLSALCASDDHDRSALRFSALWMEHSEHAIANNAVSRILPQVPTRKFTSLMNQLASRLQDVPTKFQHLLYAFVYRICTDHPFHGMYQIYAGANSRPNDKDNVAQLRLKAAKKISDQLRADPKSRKVWICIHTTNKVYCQLAAEKDDRYRGGRKLPLKDSIAGTRLSSVIAEHPIPSPTMHLKVAANLDYSTVPKMTKLEPAISIASGVSAPKIIVVLADNGARFRQLVKGGNDDMRQDAIMEQVFDQVSELLQVNRSTRQRNLRIRTYKVLPLTSIAGIIEFVADTIPIHEFLMPAHQRYHPKDLKGAQCRHEIHEVQKRSHTERLKVFRSVCERFQPVMRYFFTENFPSPDEWFLKRLAYTRSTAAISILGHILGLGDRHGHNILLDTKSGDIVHIDLGVSFEVGRVLPIPELVPFRLTRDIIDGMGITKTEGVFRRCCEFTLEALRKDAYTIMTILDVLRYDPLHSWSVSPARLAKLTAQQDQKEEQREVSVAPEGVITDAAKGTSNEPAEADRALTVVDRKLSKALSVEATVNDLINQATDERNLAVLFSGWAAYA